MAVTDTRDNSWNEPRNVAGLRRTPAQEPTGWSDAQAIGGELETWLGALTGPRRTPQDVLDDIDLTGRETPVSTHNNWREPLDAAGGDGQA
jgi:hypothetical protein